jgi:hypothetical protein
MKMVSRLAAAAGYQDRQQKRVGLSQEAMNGDGVVRYGKWPLSGMPFFNNQAIVTNFSVRSRQIRGRLSRCV